MAIFAWAFLRRRSCQISVTLKLSTTFFMRCNRKTGGLAVTQLRKMGLYGDITKILQLRRNWKKQL